MARDPVISSVRSAIDDTSARAPAPSDVESTAEGRLRLLLDAGALLSASLDLDDGLRRLADLLVTELGDYAVTYLLDGERVRRVGVGHGNSVAKDVARELLTLPPPSLATEGAGRAMTTGEPILSTGITPALLERAAQDENHLRILRALDPTSSIVVPLRARGSAFGAISLTTVRGGRPEFDATHLEFVLELANRVALMADNTRLYAELRERYDQLGVVYRMAEAVARAGAAEEVYAVALDALIDSLGAHRASILRYDDDGVLRFKAWRGISDGYRSAVEGHSPWTPDTIDPDPIMVADVEHDPHLEADLRATILGEGIRSLAFFPLAYGPGLLGKFMVYFDHPHRLSEGDVELARAVARNVSFAIVRVRDDERLRAARDAAEEASQVKSQFMAVMSHELRTPLNAIMGYADLLEARVSGGLTDRQEEHVARIRSSAGVLVELIDEVLIYARLEAGKEEVRTAEVDLGVLLRETAALVEPLSRAKGLELRVPPADPGAAGSLVVRTDPGKVRQIVLNLLSNAVKFTDHGHVELRFAPQGSGVAVTVADTGPGIPEQHRERIFEPFTQGDASATREKGGTGLGLAVSRRLCILLGGRLTVESEVGRGTTFELWIPARPE